MTERKAFTCYLYPGKDDAIIALLKAQRNRSDTIRQALVEYLARLDGDDAPDGAASPTLADFRQVIDASLEAKLSGLSLSPSAQQDNGDEVDECEAILDELASSVLM